MLIPVYMMGFFLGGIFLFAVARRIPNRKAKISLRVIGVVAGPVFFMVVAIFSGWKRERTYEAEWLTGEPVTKYLIDESNVRDKKNVVVLRRYVGNHECYEAFISQELADYPGGLKKHSVQVQYTVTYDFFKWRTYSITKIGTLEYHPNGTSWKTAGNGVGEACFPW